MKHLPSLLLASLFLAACSREQPAEPPAAKADPAAGKAVAEAKCASCHGLDGKGTGPDIPNLGGQKEAYLLNALNGYRTGARQHVALQQLATELSEADVANISAYYAGQKAAAPSAMGGGDALAAGKVAAAACFTCHGEDGNSRTKGTPSLAGQHPDYLKAAILAYKDGGGRKDAVMGAQVEKLDTVAVESIALYFASQPAATREKPTVGDPALGEPLSGKCGGCHGKQGQTVDAKTPSLAGQDARYLFVSMKQYLAGLRSHPEMKTMLAGAKDKDLEHIAAFYSVQTPAKAVIGKPTAGAQWAERCDKCHGPAATDSGMVAPHLEGQPVGYLVKALKDYREGKRVQSAMHAMGAPLNDADIQAIAEHYASQRMR